MERKQENDGAGGKGGVEKIPPVKTATSQTSDGNLSGLSKIFRGPLESFRGTLRYRGSQYGKH